jgi:hypothetical protein
MNWFKWFFKASCEALRAKAPVLPMAARLNRLLKNSFSQQKTTLGAKARPSLVDLAARLKSCPSQNLFEAEFFRSL